MKRYNSLILVLILMLVLPAGAFARNDQILITLDQFIENYNFAMDELEYEQTYGVNAKVRKQSFTINSGEVNDTIQFMLPNYGNGFLQLNLEKNKENIKEIWLFLPTRGPSKFPEFLLELFAGLAYGSGASTKDYDVVELMYDIGMYQGEAFAENAKGTITSNHVEVGYSIMNIQGNLIMMAYATPE